MSDFRRNSRLKNNKRSKSKKNQDIVPDININLKGKSIDITTSNNSLPIIFIVILIIFGIIGYMLVNTKNYSKQKEKDNEIVQSAENSTEEANNVAITEEDIQNNNDARIQLGIIGNIFCQKDIEDANNNEYNNLFNDVQNEIQNDDISIGTLGTNFVSNQITGNYNSSSEFAESLATVGIDVLDLASSHSYDYGEDGLEQTKSKVEANGMSTIGICTQNNSNGQLIKNVKGIKLGFLSYIYLDKNNGNTDLGQNQLVLNSWNSQKASDQVRELKKTADYVVVDLNLSAISKESEIDEIIKTLIDDNVDMIICTNSNVIKKLDIKTRQDGGKTFISYGLGNFLSSNTNLSLMLEVQITKEVNTGKVILSRVNYDPIYSFQDKNYKLVNVRSKINEYNNQKVDINNEKSSQTLEKQDEMVYNVLSQQLEDVEKIIGSEDN